MKVLGLDLGVTSIGGGLLTLPDKFEEWGKEGRIEWAGSRIIPVDGDYLKKFETGSEVATKAAFRTKGRGSRKLKQRYVLRRTRLIKVFKILGWLTPDFPENFKEKIRKEDGFKFNISNYLPFEQSSIDEATKLLGVKNKVGKLACSEDWVIYYLRKKALTEKISLSELARIIYMFNQRRGFKSGRKDLRDVTEDAMEKKRVEILAIKHVLQISKEKDKNGKFKFQIIPDNSSAKIPVEPWEELRFKKPEWEGKTFTLLVTVKNGKQNKPQTPQEDDYDLLLTALDNLIENSNKQVGEYFFDELVNDKNYKIRQKTVRRERYQKELKAIWDRQSQDDCHPELKNKAKLLEISQALYPSQTKAGTSKSKEILSNDLYHVIANDIIYYQRELKSQKSLISGCQYEKLAIEKNGEKIKIGVKVAPRTSPEFQEFRIWQTVHNIKIYEREQYIDGHSRIDVDVTGLYLGNDSKGYEAKEKLFELFDDNGEVDEKKVFKSINETHAAKLTKETHRISLFYKKDVTVKGNETKKLFRKYFEKVNAEAEGELVLNNPEKFSRLWHIFYSISSSDSSKSQKGIETALKNPKIKFGFSDDTIKALTSIPEVPKQYASLSTKAIKKLLPLMRCGKYWNWENITTENQLKIQRIIKDGWDKVDKETGEVVNERPFFSTEQVQGLATWMAAYVIYDRHSESVNTEKYTSYDQIDVMKLVPNNSLRNPLVEQIVRETLFLVKDLWKQHGQPDEIHIELGRDLKKNMDERAKISEVNTNNQQERERIKRLLKELLNDSFEEYVDENTTITSHFETRPNPESPMDIEKFKIWKSLAGALPEDIAAYFKEKDKKEKLPTNADIKKYALWLTQNCKSPYTGNTIPLSRLFTTAYEVEHIIPRSKMKYDANENLVICESAINPEPYKGNRLARNFISQFSGQTIKINNSVIKIFTEHEYETHCKATFRGKKLKNLLATEVPNNFISRQINDTRHITRKIAELLQPVVKNEHGLVFTIGSITSDLKREWGLNKIWKDLMKPRFERLETILDKPGTLIKHDEKHPNEYHFHVPEDPDFDLKRIDHRHHAMDALIIAATTREHIRYLNSLNAVDTSEDLKQVKKYLVKSKVRQFTKPWQSFTEDAKDRLATIITSIKANNKVVSKPKNKYQRWEEKEGKWEKVLAKQEKPKDPSKKWLAVRKSMFKEPQGIIHIKEIYEEKSIIKAIEIQMYRMKVQNTPAMAIAPYIYDQEAREVVRNLILECDFDTEKIKNHLKKNPLKDNDKKVYSFIKVAEFVPYASKRMSLNKKEYVEGLTEEKIRKDFPYPEKSRIAQLFINHVREFKNNPKEAFSLEGLEQLNKKAISDPQIGKPIKKITRKESKSEDDKFGNRYVEIDKGANAFFIMYENLLTGDRKEMHSLATHKAIERLVQGLSIADAKEGYKTIIISPNQLVYVPTPEEITNPESIDLETKDNKKRKEIFSRIYKMVSCTKKECQFIPHSISSTIISPIELGSNDKSEKAWDGGIEFVPDSKGKISRRNSGTIIKDVCIKLKVDRLGNISKA
jgi:CRISPR-associated endonuclease Csn1